MKPGNTVMVREGHLFGGIQGTLDSLIHGGKTAVLRFDPPLRWDDMPDSSVWEYATIAVEDIQVVNAPLLEVMGL
jgi:hypothetical protein